jgi:flagellum-specific ATP synthase
MKEILSTYKNAEDLINIGAYVKGSNPSIDYAVEKIGGVREFLNQGIDEKTEYSETVEILEKMFKS